MTQSEYQQLVALLDDRFTAIDRRFDGLDQRFDGLAQRIDVLDRRVEGLAQRVNVLAYRFDGLEHRVDTLERRIEEGFREVLGVSSRSTTRSSRRCGASKPCWRTRRSGARRWNGESKS